VAAGDEADQPLEPGTCHEIMTGAPLPPGADAVAPVEWTAREDDLITFAQVPSSGQHIAPRGEDLHIGATVAPAGEVVTTLGLSLLIAAGSGSVDVVARPSVAVLTSGNELVPPGAKVRRGQIRESNGPALVSLLSATGANVTNHGVARDTKEDMTTRFGAALEQADVVVLTGGSSVGRYDFSADVVAAAGGELHFDRIAVKPGKPTLFYTLGDKLVFCLPGNPVAALMTGRVLVTAALAALGGRPARDWTEARWPLGAAVGRNPTRDLLAPMRLDRQAGRLAFDGWHGSGDMVALSRAEGFAFIERGQGSVSAGTVVDWFGLPGELSW
jgi:molybdenum cofactor synthesis domain-containing protein